MSTLENLPADRLVHIVFLQPNGQRVWFARTTRREDPITKQWSIIPIADDDPRESRPVTLEYALVAQKRWRDELHLSVRIAFDQEGPLIDDPTPLAEPTWKHIDYFVVVDEANQTGYYVKAVHTPDGPMFCLKFENPILEAQSIITPLNDGPEGPIRKAKEMHFLEIEPPKVSPFKAQHEAASREAAQQQDIQTYGRVRPGCARR